MDSKLMQLTGRLADAKVALAEAEAEMRSVQQSLIERMREVGTTKVTGEDGDGRVVTAALVEPTKVVIDEDKLKRRLGAATFRKVGKTVLDKTKLEEAVKTGTVQIQDVAACSDEVPISPHIKITRKD